jgi:hypothetical protein
MVAFIGNSLSLTILVNAREERREYAKTEEIDQREGTL